MSAVGEDHPFCMPRKEIHRNEDIEKWTKSEAYHEYIGFLDALNDAIKGKSLSHSIVVSPTVSSIVDMLDNVDKIIDDTPPIDQPQRFGNKAFAAFYDKLVKSSEDLLCNALPEKFHRAVPEIAAYLTESVGNSTRIDYGTGHEMSFVLFMYCLFRIGALDCHSKDDKIGAVTKIFDRYLVLVRKLQMVYRMEPAGSHGVWSLDDFQFIPFFWGSSQLIANPKIEPHSFTDAAAVHRSAPDFMFLGCIEYIMKVKNGPFHEHSNQLYNISGAQSWTKINQGLLKMYKAEVLAKYPVIQHCIFGSLLSIQPFDANRFPGLIERPRISSLGAHIRHPSSPPPLPPGQEPLIGATAGDKTVDSNAN